MRPHPRTIAPEELAAAALKAMEEHRITSLFVCVGELQAHAVVDVEDLPLLALRPVDEAAVGHHAVHVEQQPL